MPRASVLSKKSRETAHGVEILRREEIFRGFCYTIERLSERLPGGLVVEREVVRHPGAVVILPLLDDGGVVLVEQYRPALGRRTP
ncbi:MAG: hypothetical protein ACE5GW_12935, partial [Planctomycetota bacterium]